MYSHQFIQRDYARSVEDDFKLNIQDILVIDNKEAVEVLYKGVVVGWRIQSLYD